MLRFGSGPGEVVLGFNALSAQRWKDLGTITLALL